MSETPCPFCGSPATQVKTPFVTPKLGGGSEPQYTYCCVAQARNHTFRKSRYSPLDGEPPSWEKIEKL